MQGEGKKESCLLGGYCCSQPLALKGFPGSWLVKPRLQCIPTASALSEAPGLSSSYFIADL